MLYEASDKKAYFKEVSFIIPKSWPIDSFKSLSDVRKTRIHTISDADFVVKSPGMQPFVVLLLARLLPHLLILRSIVCELTNAHSHIH